MLIEIAEEPDAQGLHPVKVDGSEMRLSALFLDLTAKRRSMSVWKAEDHAAALAVAASKPGAEVVGRVVEP